MLRKHGPIRILEDTTSRARSGKAKKRCRMMGGLGEPRGSLMMKEAEKRLWVERANTQLGVVKLESENSSGGSVPGISM